MSLWMGLDKILNVKEEDFCVLGKNLFKNEYI